MENVQKKPTKIFWVVGILFLLWNLLGCSMYLAEHLLSDEGYGEFFGQALLEVRDVYPTWSLAFYAIAVWGGLIGALTLLLRKKIAPVLFVISLCSALISFIPTFTNDLLKTAGGDFYWAMPVMVAVLGIAEVWWSRKKAADGYLN